VAVAGNIVVNELIARIPLAAGFDIYDSWPLSGDTADFVAVGVDDPFSQNAAESISATVDWAEATRRAANEEGFIWVAVVASGGETSTAQVRANAFAQLDLIDNWLRGEQHPFGLPSIWDVRVADYRATQDQTADGAACLIAVRITYRARI